MPVGDIQHGVKSKRTLKMAVQFDLGKVAKSIKGRGGTLMQIGLLETWSGSRPKFTPMIRWKGLP
jgi:hypothetical protein